MAVNYIIQPVTTQVTSGSTVGSGITNPIELTITPNQNYVVAASSFNIQGATPVNYNNNVNGYINGLNGVDFNNEEIEAATFTDNTTPNTLGNTVKVEIYVANTFTMPSNSVGIIIDIDGDATVFVPDNLQDQEDNLAFDTENVSWRFTIATDLKGTDSNGIALYTPGSTEIVPGTATVVSQDYNLEQDGGLGYKIINLFPPTLTTPEMNGILASQVVNNSVPDGFDFSTVPGTVGMIQTPVSSVVPISRRYRFLIAPKAGFTVSRHNFSFESMTPDMDGDFSLTDTFINTYNNANTGLGDIFSSAAGGANFINLKRTIHNVNYGAIFATSNFQTPWGNLVGQVVSIDLMDTQSYPVLPGNQGDNWESFNPSDVSTFNPSSFEGNHVLVEVNFLGITTPEAQDDTLCVKLLGSAMPLENSDTGVDNAFDFNVAIEYNG